MRYYIIAICFFCLGSYSLAQTKDEKIARLYSVEQLSYLKVNDLKEYNLLSHALENGTYVTKAPEGKTEGFTQSINWSLSEKPSLLELSDQYGIKLENFNQYIRINGTDKMVVVKSRIVLENELSTKKN
jgi:hypothetical protein